MNSSVWMIGFAPLGRQVPSLCCTCWMTSEVTCFCFNSSTYGFGQEAPSLDSGSSSQTVAPAWCGSWPWADAKRSKKQSWVWEWSHLRLPDLGRGRLCGGRRVPGFGRGQTWVPVSAFSCVTVAITYFLWAKSFSPGLWLSLPSVPLCG